MKASDLRIGNLINYMGSIHTVNSDIIRECELNEATSQPIELSEEILINFGFEMKQCGSGSYKYVKGIIEMHNYGGSTFKNMEIEMKGAFDAEDDEAIVNVMFPYDILYAHELQNIYKMFTREELTFKQ